MMTYFQTCIVAFLGRVDQCQSKYEWSIVSELAVKYSFP